MTMDRISSSSLHGFNDSTGSMGCGQGEWRKGKDQRQKCRKYPLTHHFLPPLLHSAFPFHFPRNPPPLTAANHAEATTGRADVSTTAVIRTAVSRGLILLYPIRGDRIKG